MRNIIGQRRSTFDLKQIMDGKGIFLANLSRGRLGENISSLLGSLLVTRFVLEALNRASLPIEQRKDFYLYLDEFHSFPTLSLADAMSEGRKYSLNLILAHQYLGQLDEEIRDAVFGNVGTIITFQLGAWDAEYLSKEFQGIFSADDLVNLPQYHVYLKQVVEGVTSRPFSAVTLPPVGGGNKIRDTVANHSRKKYGKSSVGKEIELSQEVSHIELNQKVQGSFF